MAEKEVSRVGEYFITAEEFYSLLFLFQPDAKARVDHLNSQLQQGLITLAQFLSEANKLGDETK